MFGAIEIITRGVALAAIVVMTGAIAFRWGVLRRWPAAHPAPLVEWSAHVARAGVWAAACIVIVAPLRAYTQAQRLVMAGDPVLPMIGNVMHTMWGSGWMLQCAAALTMLTGLILTRTASRAGWPLAAVSALGITLSPALMGHAIAAERGLAVSVLADWTHVAMAGAWIGSLVMLALTARSAVARGDGSAVATLIELFHPIALTCSVTLVFTGAVSVWLRVSHLADLLHSTYGAVLAIKLALTLCVAAFGLHHARRGAALALRGEPAGVLRSLYTEMVIAGLVIAATAVLVGTEPPMHDDGMQMPMHLKASAWRPGVPAR